MEKRIIGCITSKKSLYKEELKKLEEECQSIKATLLYINNIKKEIMNNHIKNIIIIGSDSQCIEVLKQIYELNDNSLSIMIISDKSISSQHLIIRNWLVDEFLTLPYCLLPFFIDLAAIVCIDKNYGIGYKEQMLGYYPEDLKYFKKKTEYNGILIGRKTLESFPNKKPLPNRDNIVLSHTKLNANNIYNIHNLYELLELSDYRKDTKKKQLYLAGGSSLYFQFLHLCNTLYITQTNETHEFIDCFFPNIEQLGEYELIENIKKGNLNFLIYKRKELLCQI